MTEGVCVGLREHLWSVVMWEFTTLCSVFCVFVSVVFCNSELAKYPDMLLPVSMTTGPDVSIQEAEAISSYNSVIIIYHKKMHIDGYLSQCYTQNYL